jgi:drug/metabolite transporter (DMT)-like permease
MSKVSAAKKGVVFALLSALAYGICTPLQKLLLVDDVSPIFMTAYIYLGAGVGMLAFSAVTGKLRAKDEVSLSREDAPRTIAAVVVNVAPMILLTVGLEYSSAQSVSMLTNFEIVTTTFFAWLFFKESFDRQMVVAVVVILVSTMLVSVDDLTSISFSWGSLLVLLSCVLWGLENALTRALSSKNPFQLTTIKGFGTGLCTLAIAFLFEKPKMPLVPVILTILLGIFIYSAEILLYILAQRYIGGIRTSAYYGCAPFFGVALSLVIFRNQMTVMFVIALVLMVVGVILVGLDHKKSGNGNANVSK